MAHVTKNYNENGGDIQVIKGTLKIEGTLEIGNGATVTGLAAENQANSTATDVAGLVTNFNALLAKLKAAGLMEADS